MTHRDENVAQCRNLTDVVVVAHLSGLQNRQMEAAEGYLASSKDHKEGGKAGKIHPSALQKVLPLYV